jgi:uncharacterized protein (DUF58 family)
MIKFDQEFLKKLEYLRILSKLLVRGRIRGERRTKKTGSGVEFADYRNYTPGDDFRYIDWNIYARLSKVLLRLYEEEEDLFIYILLDSSASMGMGEPSKLDYGIQIAAALSYIGIANLDRVGIESFSDSEYSGIEPARGRGHIFRIFRFLEKISSHGLTNINNAIKSFVTRNKRRGVCIFLTDLYDTETWRDGLSLLRYSHFETFLFHLIDTREFSPPVLGDVRIVDCETDEPMDVTISHGLLDAYREMLELHLKNVEDFSLKNEIVYFCPPIQMPFDELILNVLRKGGIIK